MSAPALRSTKCVRRDLARTGGECGFSLIEVMIAAFILFLIIGIAAQVILAGNNLLSTTLPKSSAEINAQTIAQYVADRLRNGVLTTITNSLGATCTGVVDGASPGAAFADATSTTNGIRVQLADGYAGGPIPGKYVGIYLENGESNGTNSTDDNGNHVADEKFVRLKEWASTADPDADAPTQNAIFAGNVKSLTIERDGSQFTVTVVVLCFDSTLRQDTGVSDYRETLGVRRITATSRFVLRN